MSSIKTPYQKKQQSLERDHVTPPEHPAEHRHGWPKKKAGTERAYRHTVKQVLETTLDDEEVARIAREKLEKEHPPSLREALEHKAADKAPKG
jgi:hypothetical protein